VLQDVHQLAALVVFKMPHGFEEQVGWYFILLPGAFFTALISDSVAGIGRQIDSIVFVGLLVCVNFIWYFLICFTCIKVYRTVSGSPKDLS
jgi:hypothetical protein